MTRFWHQVLALLRRNRSYHKAELLAQRDASSIAQSLEMRREDLVFDRSDWVSAWVDPRQVYWSRDGLTQATRAITVNGRLIWLVSHPKFKRPYHSREETAMEAFSDAENAWHRKLAQAHAKRAVREIAYRLATFRESYAVVIDDAYRSPLCDEGVDGFLRSLGVPGIKRCPGWLVAWFYYVDRQVGFVIYEAHKRHVAEQG
ncbi:MAG: hypothetical protein AAGD43_17830, partial [Pseudomonadota bacterium]